jgi:hypothetical protein
MKTSWGKTYLKFLVLLVIIAGVFSGFLLVKNTQLLSSSALTPSSVGNVDVIVGEPKDGISRVDLKFKTGLEDGQSEAISTLAFTLNVKSKSGSTIGMVDQEGLSVEKMVPGGNISSENHWEIPVNEIVNVENGFAVDFMAVNTDKDGYNSTMPEVLVSFYVKGIGERNDLSLDFDKGISVMYSKRRPVTDIWEE